MNPSSLRRRHDLLVVGAILAVVIGLGGNLFALADTWLRDRWVRWRFAAQSPTEHPWVAWGTGWLMPADGASSPIILVVQDDRAFLNIPEPQPWNRRLWAAFVDFVASGRPRVIGFDIFFQQAREDDPGQNRALADAVRAAGNVVLIGYRQAGRTMARPYPELAAAATVAPPYLFRFVDEVYRKASLVFRPVEGPALPAFETELARRYWGLPPESCRIGPDAIEFDLPAGNRSVPLIDGESLLINYDAAFHRIPQVSLADIYHKQISPEVFRDRIVLFGINYSLVEDRFYTPTGHAEFGTRIHAMALQNLLEHRFLLPVAPGHGQVLALVLTAAWLFVLAPRLAPLPFAVITGTGVVALAGLSFVGMLHFGRLFEVTAPGFAVTAAYVVAIASAHSLEIREKERMKESRLRELDILYEVSNAASVVGDHQGILAHILERATAILDASGAVIVVPDESGDGLTVRAVHGAAVAGWADGAPSRFLALAAGVQKSGQGARLALPDVADCEEGGVLLAPMQHKNAVIGVMGLLRRPHTGGFSADDLRLLNLVASQTAVTSESARLYELATTDGMTKLFVHRFFLIRLNEEIIRARRHGLNVGLIMSDIDNFKSFNDRFGHPVGDEVLRRVAKVYRESVRPVIDVPCRYGGEEMCAVLPGLDAEAALAVAERIRLGIAEIRIEHPTGDLRVTCSFGVADYPSCDSREALIKRADAALYVSKKRGKNRCTRWTPDLAA